MAVGPFLDAYGEMELVAVIARPSFDQRSRLLSAPETAAKKRAGRR